MTRKDTIKRAISQIYLGKSECEYLKTKFKDTIKRAISQTYLGKSECNHVDGIVNHPAFCLDILLTEDISLWYGIFFVFHHVGFPSILEELAIGWRRMLVEFTQKPTNHIKSAHEIMLFLYKNQPSTIIYLSYLQNTTKKFPSQYFDGTSVKVLTVVPSSH